MGVFDELLEQTCKNMIKTILFCVENAYKGTIYRIGPLPELRAVRVTSGIRVKGSDEIQWGLPSVSDYNHPGKTWEQYRDRPNHVLEAMGWAVEKQKSWTAENPFEDVRSVGKQLRGEIEDYYHMEPVLVRKRDLYVNCPEPCEYPREWRGNTIWQDSDYIVAAVIKIHYLPQTLRRGDHSTKIIKELSRSLGTELLSLHLREGLARSQKELDRQRIQSCQILAHELRNTLIRFGFLFLAINAQISMIRGEWESLLREAFPDLEWKESILRRLNDLVRLRLPLVQGREELISIGEALLLEQQYLAQLPLLPVQGEQWLKNRIQPKWERLLKDSQAWDSDKETIAGLLIRLRGAFCMGTDEDIISRVKHLPADIVDRWTRVAYVEFTPERLPVLDEAIQLLDHPILPIPHKQQIRKVLTSLKVLVEVVPEVEERANRIIQSLRYGDQGTTQELNFACGCQLASQVSIEGGTSLSD